MGRGNSLVKIKTVSERTHVTFLKFYLTYSELNFMPTGQIGYIIKLFRKPTEQIALNRRR